MRYGSVCSGIEAASVAWEPLGWEPAWFAEIDKFPSAVLAHHFPNVPNLGDFTKIGADRGGIDILVGGTPCQSFSISGKRAGLDDPRGVLALEFLRLAQRLGPRWLVWENVPGVLSHDGGRTFGSILGALGQCGYGFAYRVLDAKYFGVPQRRRRVFIVGHSGGAWQRAAAVLFEPESLSGDFEASPEEAGEATGTLTTRTGNGRDNYSVEQGHCFLTNGLPRWPMPIECERLQGFPDGWTQLYSDAIGPRYKAIGNSMAVPVMRWIGERIQLVDSAQ